MNVIVSHQDGLIHFKQCMNADDSEDSLLFESLKEALAQGFELSTCCDAMRKRLFDKGFVIKGPGGNTEFYSERDYYPIS